MDDDRIGASEGAADDRTTDDGRSTDDDRNGGDDRTEDRSVDRDRSAYGNQSPDDESEYRVLGVPEAGRLRLLDRETYEPVVTADAGHDAPVGDVLPGYLVEADLDWSSAEPTVESLSVRRPALYAFADEIDPVFEVARDAWADARASGDAMNSRVTRNTDNEVNGVLYVFAEDGATSTFEEFRDGARPLEPLVDRVNDRDGPAPREVFVLRPASGEFVIVTIALRKGGQFADTLRDTYDVPRPPEPLG